MNNHKMDEIKEHNTDTTQLPQILITFTRTVGYHHEHS